MSPSQLAPFLLAQATAAPDTVVTRVVQDRDFFEYASGTLEIVVLLLGAVALGTLVWMLIAMRRALVRSDHAVKVLTEDARPILRHAAGVAEDARKTVASLREDVERVTDAAATVSEQLLDAAEITARRIDEVNAVIDVVQHELENAAISSVAAIKGVRVGASEMASALGSGRNGRKRVSRAHREELEHRRREHQLPGEVEPG